MSSLEDFPELFRNFAITLHNSFMLMITYI